jgi:tetratricopeptide (TPR) repeat protein
MKHASIRLYNSYKEVTYAYAFFLVFLIFSGPFLIFIIVFKAHIILPKYLILFEKYSLINYSSQEYTVAGKKLFLDNHNNHDALINLKKAVELNPKNGQAWFLLGRVNFVLGNLSRSASDFQEVIELDSRNEQAYYGLGLAHGYQSNLDLAASSFHDYLTIIEEKKSSGEYQDYPPGHWAGYNDLAWIYFLQGNFKEAEKITAEALRKYNNPWLLNMMGAILLNQDRKEDAQIYFQRAKEYSQNITAEDFGEAYTGDNKEWHEKGFANMKQIIEENIQNASK